MMKVMMKHLEGTSNNNMELDGINFQYDFTSLKLNEPVIKKFTEIK